MKGIEAHSSFSIQDQTKLKQGFVQAILILLVGLGPTSFQIFLPAVPEITAYFNTTPAMANLTVSLSMISFAIASLVYGRLADQFGRRSILLFGMAVLTVGSALCLFGTSIEMVILGRLIQPAGGAAGVIAARIIVLDIYDKDEAGNVMAKLAAAMMVAPLLGVPLGGVLTDQFGWQSNFVFIGSAAIASLVLVWVYLPETRTFSEPSGEKQSLFADYRRLVRHRVFAANTLQFAFAQAAFMVFLSGAPFIFVKTYGLSASNTSLALLAVSASAVGGNIFASMLSKKVTLKQRLIVGSLFGCLGGVAAVAFSLASIWTLLALVIPAMVFSFSNGVSSPAAQTGSIAAIKELSGTAAGFSMFLSMVFASLSTQLLSTFNDGTPVALTVGFSILTVLSFLAAISIVAVKEN